MLLVYILALALDDIRIPIQVDQQGKTIQFVVFADSNVMLEASKFCHAHLGGMDAEECQDLLIKQVEHIRSARQESQYALPGIKFSVQTNSGKTVQFVHEEGANPSEEARDFCQIHFPKAPEDQCVETMISHAQKALEEIQEKIEL